MAFSMNRKSLLKILVATGSPAALAEFLCAHREHVPALLNTGWEDERHDDPPLAQAAARGDTTIVRCLLDAGAQLEVTAAGGFTPLFRAFEHGHLQVADLLIERGADPTAQSAKGTRVFDMVLRSGDLARIEIFVARGFLLQYCSTTQVSTLHWAARSGVLAVYERVRDATSFRADHATRSGQRVLDWAGSLEVFERAHADVPGMPLDVVFDNGDHSLHRHALHARPAIVAALLDADVDIETPGAERRTALHAAVLSDDLATVELLLSRGAKVDARKKNDIRPLHHACERGRLDIVRCLVEHKTKLDVRANRSFIIRETPTALGFAIQNGHVDVARYLIENGADSTLTLDSSQGTALSLAVRKDLVEIVDLLLQHGANPDGTVNRDDDQFEFPLSCAETPDIVDRLVAAGADVNARNRYSETALHFLADRLRNPFTPERRATLLATADALLRHGADPDAVDHQGSTPLSRNHDSELSRRLLAARNVPSSVRPPSEATRQRQARQDNYWARVGAFVAGMSDEKAQAVAEQAQVRAEAANLGPVLFALCHNDCNSVRQVENVALLLQHAHQRDIDYVSADSFDKRNSLVLRLIRASERSKYDDEREARAPVAAYVALVQCALDVTAGRLNHRGGTRGETPLHAAVRAAQSALNYGGEPALEGFSALVDLLIARGADVNAVSDDGYRPLDLTVQPRLVASLRAHGAKPGAYPIALFDAIRYGDAAMFGLLLAQTADLDRRCTYEHDTSTGCSALLYAAQLDRLDAVRALLDAGASPHVQADQGSGLLHHAAWHGATTTLRWLVEHLTLDLNAPDAEGAPPLHYLLAARASSGDLRDSKTFRADTQATAIWLVERGAAIDRRCRQGHTVESLVGSKKFLTMLQRAARRCASGIAAAAGQS